MGIYVNPPDMTKEEFLVLYGQSGSIEMAHDFLADPCACHLLCCWVRNDEFTALAVCNNREEFSAYSQPDDPRVKRWFIVDADALEPYIPGARLQ